MSTIQEIPQLEEIITQKLLGESKKLVKYNTKSLVGPGENYGSIIFALDLTIEDTNTSSKEEQHAVGKMVPNNEFVTSMFQPHITFVKEYEFYNTIVPTLKEYEKTQNLLNLFPEYYGGRLGLNEQQLDSNAIILLENLKYNNFVNVERTKGFGLEETKLILKDLAKFHASIIALKLKQPDIFKTKINPYIKYFNLMSTFDEDKCKTFFPDLLNVIRENPECSQYVERYEKAFKRSNKIFFQPPEIVEPFATLTHSDMWVNNILIRYENGIPVESKFVDFQLIMYGSPGLDISFLLFTSVQNHVILQYYDEFLTTYFDEFMKILKIYDVDNLDNFTLNGLVEEIGRSVRDFSVFRCTLMLFPMFLPKKNAKPVDTMSDSDFEEKIEMTQEFKAKLCMIVKEFAKREWI